MRTALFFYFLLSLSTTLAQRSVVINELQAANRHTYVEADGSTPDWIELYNPGTEAVDLAGMRFSVVGRMHVIEAPLVLAPGELKLLWFDGHPERGNDHIGFTLPRKGGTLLLIAADGTTVLDIFTYPAMAGDLSVGRVSDGSNEWTFHTCATPGTANEATVPLHRRTTTPFPDSTLSTNDRSIMLGLLSEEGATIRYTMDGTEPTAQHGMAYTGPITIEEDLVVRARAFTDHTLPSKEFCATYVLGGAAMEGLTIALDQEGLTDDSTGINVEGALANFSRKGRAWERLAMVKFNGTEDAPIPIGISIHGSGSRGLPKRSFKLHARDRYDSPVKGLRSTGDEHFQEGILRADAGAHTFLRNRFMEELVKRHRLALDVQPSLPVPLYLNGTYWGLYRWMPPKDAQWLKHVSGSEAVDVLEGPAGVVRSGSDAAFKPAMEQLMTLAPLDSLANHIDLANLIDLACLDLWTGRADHDLNVRCYRPRKHEGRWRWVLFDMDLWAPPDENSVQRMAVASGPETPYIPQLLQHADLQEMLLARITALMATALHPVQALALADTVYRTHEAALLDDHERWQAQMKRPHPKASAEELARHIADRPAHLMRYLAKATERALRTVWIDVPRDEQATVLLNGSRLAPGKQEVVCFSGIRSRLDVFPEAGYTFAGWKGVDGQGPLLEVELARCRSLQPKLSIMAP